MRLYIFIGLVILLVGMVFMGVYYHIINNYFVVGDTIVYDLFFTFIQTVSSNNFFMNYGLWDNTANTMILANQNLANFIFEKAGLGSDRDNLVILDVGCGYGEQDLLWSGKMNKTCKITAVDISSTQITSANQRRLKRNILEENLEFVQGDALRLLDNFQANKFDTVLSLESAFHYPDRPLFFKNVYSLLHLFSFETPILQGKKIRKSVKSIVVLSTYVVLTTIVSLFPVSSNTGERHCLRENSLGLVWFSIQDLVSFLIFTAELASRVLNTVSLF